MAAQGSVPDAPVPIPTAPVDSKALGTTIPRDNEDAENHEAHSGKKWCSAPQHE
ncbi:MAG: hypothetical protein HC810_05980 [Acaryochloridaceae cyanobacterium RL_2_7]|nr:hypothetical protein [Acaryochloridaceae cyanobacterium RL_2_7]